MKIKMQHRWMLHLIRAREETRTPTGVTPQASETCASTSSATRAEKFVVPGARLELASLAAYAPQTYVYTNSTIRAIFGGHKDMFF